MVQDWRDAVVDGECFCGVGPFLVAGHFGGLPPVCCLISRFLLSWPIYSSMVRVIIANLTFPFSDMRGSIETLLECSSNTIKYKVFK